MEGYDVLRVHGVQLIIGFALAVALVVAPVSAKSDEFRNLPEAGLSALLPSLDRLPVSLSVMQIGAHPDDEDNSLMAYLVKGLHADT